MNIHDLQPGMPIEYLAMTARVHERVRHVVETSRNMNMIAINAMLTAKQAGERARGITVVAGEMRIFSQQLNASSERLNGAITRLVREVSTLRKEQRQLRYLQVVRDKTQARQSLLGPAVARNYLRMTQMEEEVGVSWEKMSRELRQSSRLAQVALALGRSANIEAAHGGSMVASLKQVAEEIDTTANRIMDGMKLLRTSASAM